MSLDTKRSYNCQAEAGEAAPSSPSQQSKELKGLYREQYSELQMVKAEAEYTQKLVEQCTQELVMDFQEWCVPCCCGQCTQ